MMTLNVLFYACDNNTYDEKNFSQSCLVHFQMTFYTKKKCRVLHIENQTSNQKISSIKLLRNIMQISLMVYAFFKHKIRVSDVNF